MSFLYLSLSSDVICFLCFNSFSSSWISLNYDKRDFKKDRKSLDQSIKNKKVKNYFSMILKDGEAEELENILNQKTMKKHESEPINVFEMDKFLREVNDLITKNIFFVIRSFTSLKNLSISKTFMGSLSCFFIVFWFKIFSNSSASPSFNIIEK